MDNINGSEGLISDHVEHTKFDDSQKNIYI